MHGEWESKLFPSLFRILPPTSPERFLSLVNFRACHDPSYPRYVDIPFLHFPLSQVSHEPAPTAQHFYAVGLGTAHTHVYLNICMLARVVILCMLCVPCRSFLLARALHCRGGHGAMTPYHTLPDYFTCAIGLFSRQLTYHSHRKFLKSSCISKTDCRPA